MKKVLSIILSILLIFSGTFCSFAESEIPLKLYSDAALVCDMTTGEIIYSLNADELRYPASTTKMLTAILALENLDLEDTVTVDKEAAGVGGNSLKLKSGEKFKVKDLLYGTLVISANDGAVALAKKVSGSVEEFAKLMNKKAIEIGCTSSNFVNPNGLHDDNHYTTARDLALIAMYCMKNETFREIVSLPSYTVPATNLSEERVVENTNW
ncbi:MAG: serine hydrolase, partial [Bacillota bacterium]|nr:serine hydrolase [Bacillota bacterium]